MTDTDIVRWPTTMVGRLNALVRMMDDLSNDMLAASDHAGAMMLRGICDKLAGLPPQYGPEERDYRLSYSQMPLSDLYERLRDAEATPKETE